MGNARYSIGSPFAVTPSAGNAMSNGTFDTNATGWSALGANVSVARETGTKRTGAGSLKISTSSFSVQMRAEAVAVTGIKKGRRFSARCWVYGGGTINAKTVSLRLLAYGGAESDAEIGVGTATIYTSAWRVIAVDGVVDENDRTGVKVQVGLASGDSAGATGDIIYVDDVFAGEVDEGRLGGDFLVPIDVYLESGTAASGYDVANVRGEHLGATFRSSDLSDCAIVFDFGKAVSPDAIMVEGVNTDAVKITSTANITGADDYSQTPTVEANPWTGRYQRLQVTDGATARRFWRLEFASGFTDLVDDGDTFWEVARVSFVKEDGLNTLAQNWAVPFRIEPMDRSSVKELPGGRTVDRLLGFRYVQIAAVQDFDRSLGDGIEAQVKALAAARMDERILHFENWGSGDSNNARAHVCRKSAAMGVAYAAWPMLSVDIGLREVT